MRSLRKYQVFLRSDLRHHVDNDATLLYNPEMGSWIRRVYAILLRWADRGENVDDYAELDLVSSHLAEAAPVFAGLLQAQLDGMSSEESKTLAQEDSSGMEAQRELMAAQEANLQALREQLEQGEAQLAEAEQAREALEAQRRDEGRDLQAKLAAASQAHLALEARLEWMSGEHYRQLTGLSAQFEARQTEMAAEREQLTAQLTQQAEQLAE